MSELFTPSTITQDSPRLAWMKRYDVETREVVEDETGAADGWMATGWNRDRKFAVESASEDEAIAALALRMGVRLWNERGVK